MVIGRTHLRTKDYLRFSKKIQNMFWIFTQILVISAGFEPAIAWMRTRSPGPLDDETVESL